MSRLLCRYILILCQDCLDQGVDNSLQATLCLDRTRNRNTEVLLRKFPWFSCMLEREETASLSRSTTLKLTAHYGIHNVHGGLSRDMKVVDRPPLSYDVIIKVRVRKCLSILRIYTRASASKGQEFKNHWQLFVTIECETWTCQLSAFTSLCALQNNQKLMEISSMSPFNNAIARFSTGINSTYRYIIGWRFIKCGQLEVSIQ